MTIRIFPHMTNRRDALKNLAFTTGALAISGRFAFAQAPAGQEEGAFKLPPLGYDYDALEPFIDAQTMKLHHDKHHAAYVSKLNQAVAPAPELQKEPIEKILGNLDAVPE